MQKKRKDKRYQANIVVGYNESTGKRIYHTVYANSIPSLNIKKAEIINAKEKGMYANDQKLTVSTWGYKWLDIYKSNKESSTYSGYKNIIKNHLGAMKDIRLKDLRKSDIQKAINDLNGHKDLQRRLKLTINQMLEYAIDDGLVYKNVCRNVELPNMQRKEKRALTQYEKDSIEKADFTEREKVFVYLLLYTGMRRGEILALTKSDIDFKENIISVNKSLAFESNAARIKEPKTPAANRLIDIYSPLEAILKPYYYSLNNLYLFTNTSGNILSRTSYVRLWETIYFKINTAAGGSYHYEKSASGKSSRRVVDIDAVKGLTPHIFRHNFATMLYYAEVDIKDAQRILGHADSKTTLDIYTHLDNSKSKSKSKMEKYIAI